MERTDKNVVLILARELASNLATPMFLIDPWGKLLFYNEPAEDLLGQSFARTGEIGPDEWGTIWQPEDLDGNPIKVEDLPLARSLTERIPVHHRFRITALDGTKRTIAATTFPLFARADKFVGAVSVFWEER